MKKILANDGIDAIGKQMLESAGFVVETTKIPQDQLNEKLKDYDAITVRSATKVRKDTMDANPQLKLIGRGGVGLDNIDVYHAKQRGIRVINTPMSSSASVAELVFAHIFSGARLISHTNRVMGTDPISSFNDLKKQASNGVELRGKIMGIIGFGRIGQEVAKIALGMGMDVLAFDPFVDEVDVPFYFHKSVQSNAVKIKLRTVSKEAVINNSDFISLHVPFNEGDKAVIGETELAKMKKGSGIVNCARGGVIDEAALILSLKSGHLLFAGLDVFASEPPKEKSELFTLPNVSLSPHIGGSTAEAQNRIGIELAEKIIEFFKNN
ncbi:MAG: 3-phosphoglycerate dehydrogenase [Flavobacteriaceae bacterium]|nr:3-phosphoglycerate dehydrogenase [Flavobacteriaceae bacterium]